MMFIMEVLQQELSMGSRLADAAWQEWLEDPHDALPDRVPASEAGTLSLTELPSCITMVVLSNA